MTRLELLTLAVNRAHSHGFDLRRWYTRRLLLPWISVAAALALLDQQRRYYALRVSHEFAQAFWKAGEEISFEVPARTYQRKLRDGSTTTVNQRSFMRRSSRRDAWRYHLREMALAEEPLRYLKRYFQEGSAIAMDEPEPAAFQTGSLASNPARAVRRLPDELPLFLRRPVPNFEPLAVRSRSNRKLD